MATVEERAQIGFEEVTIENDELATALREREASVAKAGGRQPGSVHDRGQVLPQRAGRSQEEE